MVGRRGSELGELCKSLDTEACRFSKKERRKLEDLVKRKLLTRQTCFEQRKRGQLLLCFVLSTLGFSVDGGKAAPTVFVIEIVHPWARKTKRWKQTKRRKVLDGRHGGGRTAT
jgi:DNA primase catalytic subunit